MVGASRRQPRPLLGDFGEIAGAAPQSGQEAAPKAAAFTSFATPPLSCSGCFGCESGACATSDNNKGSNFYAAAQGGFRREKPVETGVKYPGLQGKLNVCSCRRSGQQERNLRTLSDEFHRAHRHAEGAVDNCSQRARATLYRESGVWESIPRRSNRPLRALNLSTRRHGWRRVSRTCGASARRGSRRGRR